MNTAGVLSLYLWLLSLVVRMLVDQTITFDMASLILQNGFLAIAYAEDDPIAGLENLKEFCKDLAELRTFPTGKGADDDNGSDVTG